MNDRYERQSRLPEVGASGQARIAGSEARIGASASARFELAYLVRAGVTEARLTSEGFGSTKPIDDNKTEPGRAKNRRVEFHFSL